MDKKIRISLIVTILLAIFVVAAVFVANKSNVKKKQGGTDAEMTTTISISDNDESASGGETQISEKQESSGAHSGNGNNESGTTDFTSENEIQSDINVSEVQTDGNGDLEMPENETPKVEVPEDIKDFENAPLDVDKMPGFEKDDERADDGSSGSGIVLDEASLVVEAVGGYTGNYVEDGSDDVVKNVASLVVTNNSDKMLQVGDLEFRVNENENAIFRITNLLPGESVLVMEISKRPYSKDDDYSYGKTATAWLEDFSIRENEFSFEKENGKLTLKNKTNKSYKKVYVYYKYVQTGGAYFGGITYRVPFDNVEAKASVESIANHYSKYTSRIVDVQVTE